MTKLVDDDIADAIGPLCPKIMVGFAAAIVLGCLIWLYGCIYPY